MQEVAGLKPFMKKVNLKVKAIEKKEIREVTSRLDNTTHKVTEAVVADATGAVLLTLWDDKIDAVEDGKTYEIENGFTSLFKQSIRLNIGRFGTLKEAEAPLEEVNTDNNISDKEVE
jgi:replication factor A1